jgi:hypothetical protein
METECKINSINFQPLNDIKKIIAVFDGGKITSDAGALFLREIEKKHHFIHHLSKCFTDYRDQDKIEHSLEELLSQRIFSICLGYEDLNDHDSLRYDPLIAIACNKNDPEGKDRESDRDKGKALAGKSTLNRLELSGEGDLSKERYKKIEADFSKIENFFVKTFLAKHKTPPEQIIIDIDSTDDEIHGNQEGRFFHGYYDCFCYLPLYIFCGDDLLAAKLRPSNIDGSYGVKKELKRIIKLIRKKWKKTKIIVRGDSGFCRDKIMSWCEGNGIHYIFGMAKNKRLLENIQDEMVLAKSQFMETKNPSRVFKEFIYKTLDSWNKERRIIAKAEYLEKGENPRFIVTNIESEESAQELYENVYCARGEMENRIKEQQAYLFADRTSTETMRGNQLRLWFSGVAYVFLNMFREIGLKNTEYAESTCETIRLKFLKIGAQIKISVRRIYISLSESYPLKDIFMKIAFALRC